MMIDNDGSQDIGNKVNIWQIYPGDKKEMQYLWPLFEKEGYIGIGWFSDKDYKEFKSKEEIKDALINNGAKEKTTSHHMIWNFTHSIKIGDVIIASGSRKKILAIGVVKSDYISPKDQNNPQLDDEYTHVRKVSWIIKEEVELDNYFFGRNTLSDVNEDRWNIIKSVYVKNFPYTKDLQIFNLDSRKITKTAGNDNNTKYWVSVLSLNNYKLEKKSNDFQIGVKESVKEVKNVKKGDYVIYYIGGGVSKFLGIFIATSDYFYDDSRVWKDDVYPRRAKLKPILLAENTDECVSAEIIKEQLDFITNKDSWGMSFIRPIRTISKKDFDFIKNELEKKDSKRGYS